MRRNLPARPEIVFMGTPDFAVCSLNALLRHGHNVSCVVTQPDRPRGRGRKMLPSPVKGCALEADMEVLQPSRASDGRFCDLIREKNPDIIIVVAFGQILKKELLEIPKWGVLNIHASLLPFYRGAAPIQWAVINNEKKTGLSAMKMDEGMDTGPVLIQQEVPIGKDDTAGDLHDRLAALSGDFLLRTLEGISTGVLNESAQDDEKATYAPKIDRSMALIDWERPAEEISALIRGLDPWPGAYTMVAGKQLKLFSPELPEHQTGCLCPGTVTGAPDGCLEIGAGSGNIRVRELQLSGKKRLPAGDFMRGFPIKVGTRFET